MHIYHTMWSGHIFVSFFFFILFLLEYVYVWCLALKLEGQDLLYVVKLYALILSCTTMLHKAKFSTDMPIDPLVLTSKKV